MKKRWIQRTKKAKKKKIGQRSFSVPLFKQLHNYFSSLGASESLSLIQPIPRRRRITKLHLKLWSNGRIIFEHMNNIRRRNRRCHSMESNNRLLSNMIEELSSLRLSLPNLAICSPRSTTNVAEDDPIPWPHPSCLWHIRASNRTDLFVIANHLCDEV